MSRVDLDLSGRVAVVTGSSRGIGRAIATRLAQHSAAVVVNYTHSDEQANDLVGTLSAEGLQAIAVKADISQPDEARHLIEAAVSKFGRLDILVNNAGVTRDTLLLRLNNDDWDIVLDTNLRGAFFCTKAAMKPMLKQRWGRIISVASIVGVVGNPGQSNYAAAKGGLIAFTKSVAREVATRGITANAVAPGFIDTDMTRALPEQTRQEVLRQIPFSRFGKPEDVAGPVVFLASDLAAYVTGQVLNVDGGMVMA
ncbi:MAG: 3-oxoacyl-[acyl-carrier-protein] reductase [Chloroflexota bacterium]|nr:MAG: 3-oxoacyl-[acyl-carrier-protein] reductase [Chloroflexota bacterium]